MRAARRAPELKARHFAEDKQCLADCTCRSLHEHTLPRCDALRAVKHLIGGHPTQDERRGLCRIYVRRQLCEAASGDGSILRIRTEHCQTGNTLAALKASHPTPDLVDFANKIIADHEG